MAWDIENVRPPWTSAAATNSALSAIKRAFTLQGRRKLDSIVVVHKQRIYPIMQARSPLPPLPLSPLPLPAAAAASSAWYPCCRRALACAARRCRRRSRCRGRGTLEAIKHLEEACVAPRAP